MDEQRHMLVAGASGVIGSAAVEHFARLPGWRVTALSRRRPFVAQEMMDLRLLPRTGAPG